MNQYDDMDELKSDLINFLTLSRLNSFARAFTAYACVFSKQLKLAVIIFVNKDILYKSEMMKKSRNFGSNLIYKLKWIDLSD